MDWEQGKIWKKLFGVGKWLACTEPQKAQRNESRNDPSKYVHLQTSVISFYLAPLAIKLLHLPPYYLNLFEFDLILLVWGFASLTNA